MECINENLVINHSIVAHVSEILQKHTLINCL